MKNLIYILLCFISLSVFAQEKNQTTTKFVRIYNLEHKKIGKGIIQGVDETNLYVKRNSKILKIPFTDIGKIKTKRSFGRHVLYGLSSGALVVGLGNAIAYDDNSISGPKNRVDAAIGGAFVGIVLGSVVGGITHFFIPNKQFIINGNINLWNDFKASYTQIKLNQPNQ